MRSSSRRKEKEELATTTVLVQERQQRPKRPLRLCQVCGKEGYLYVRNRDGHRYIYTIHKNEPPIGTYSSGLKKYRWCYDNGRLYDSLEEAVKADKLKERRLRRLHHKKTVAAVRKVRKVRTTSIGNQYYALKMRTGKRSINCPECHHRGTLNFADRKLGRYLVRHKTISKQGLWGRGKNKVKKYDRCYLSSTSH